MLILLILFSPPAQGAVLEDSLLVLAEGLTRLACGAWRGLEPDLAANCRQELPWQAGTSLYNYLNSVDTVGEQSKTYWTAVRATRQ